MLLGKRERVMADRPLNSDEALLFADPKPHSSQVRDCPDKRRKLDLSESEMQHSLATDNHQAELTSCLKRSNSPVGFQSEPVLSQTTTETP